MVEIDRGQIQVREYVSIGTEPKFWARLTDFFSS